MRTRLRENRLNVCMHCTLHTRLSSSFMNITEHYSTMLKKKRKLIRIFDNAERKKLQKIWGLPGIEPGTLSAKAPLEMPQGFLNMP